MVFDYSEYSSEPTFLDYMARRVHEKSDVGDLARTLVNLTTTFPGRVQSQFVVIDELLDWVSEFEREAAAQAWLDYRRYLTKWRRDNLSTQEAA